MKVLCVVILVAVVVVLSAHGGVAVDVSVGRQLFVDDLLVESVDGVSRYWNHPTKIDNPFVCPESGAAPKVVDGSSGAKDGEAVNLTCATDGGLWWDPTRRKFRLWYQADWLGDICYAESSDGEKWECPDLGIVPGTNRIFEHDIIDSWSVTPNYAAKNPYADWKLHVSYPYTSKEWPPTMDDRLWESKDGIRFSPLGLAGRSVRTLVRLNSSIVYHIPIRQDPMVTPNFVFMLAIAAVAAPGVMGGVLMASVGLVESILGFTPEQTALLMTFYLALDGYGPAANVTGDGAVALALDRFFGGSENERSTS